VLLSATSILVAGCSGINTTQSVSPASFFLPGLNFLKTDPALPCTNSVPPMVEPVKQLAQAR
jgi:hypothetical protein